MAVLVALMSLIGSDLQAMSWPCFRLGEHRLWIAPEVYNTKRLRQGGTHQQGWLGGIRACLERNEINALYWGVEGGWAKGPLEGRSFSGGIIRLNMTDADVEGRLGFTLGSYGCVNISLTPFVGVGCYKGEMRFIPPTPLTLRFCDTYTFASAGLLARVWCDEGFSMGINVKARQMYNGKERITDDPDLPDVILMMKDELCWLFELPLSWRFCYEGWPAEVGIMPFYENRHYGGREGFPMDFVDTQYFVYGLRFTLGTSF